MVIELFLLNYVSYAETLSDITGTPEMRSFVFYILLSWANWTSR